MFSWLKRKKSKEEVIEEGKMYDLRQCCWGHSIEFDGNGELPHSKEVHGWLTPCVSKGDTFLFPAIKGLAVWMLIKVRNCNDPKDMFFGTVGIIRYATEEDLEKVKQIKADVQSFRFV